MRFKIKFSQHALERMEERGISQVIVRKALNFPDKVEKSLIESSRLLVKKLYFDQRFTYNNIRSKNEFNICYHNY